MVHEYDTVQGVGVGTGEGVGGGDVVALVIFIVATLYRFSPSFVTPFPVRSSISCHGLPQERPTKILYCHEGMLLGIIIVRVSTAFPVQCIVSTQ